MNIIKYIAIVLLLLPAIQNLAQGPPIITDKPIMLGEKRIVLKTLTRYEVRDHAQFYNIPLMAHYIIKPNLLVAAHFPMAGFRHKHGDHWHQQRGIGDINAQIKYQFFRWDKSSKTARAAVKLQQFFPTGINTNNYEISLGEWQTWMGLTFGYEALRYGLGANIGYHYVAGDKSDYVHYRLSAGLPLMPLVYPPKQINLYFEYDGEINTTTRAHNLFMAQGFQYAMRRITFETSIRFPIFQNEPEEHQQKYTLLFGTRFII